MSAPLDTLCAALTKAHALSLMTHGEAGECLRAFRDDIQDAYLWALSGLLDDAVEAMNALISSEKGGAA